MKRRKQKDECASGAQARYSVTTSFDEEHEHEHEHEHEVLKADVFQKGQDNSGLKFPLRTLMICK